MLPNIKQIQITCTIVRNGDSKHTSSNGIVDSKGNVLESDDESWISQGGRIRCDFGENE